MSKFLQNVKDHPSALFAVLIAFIGIAQALLAFPRPECILGLLASRLSIAIIIQDTREAKRAQAKVKVALDLASEALSKTPSEIVKANVSNPRDTTGMAPKESQTYHR